jgi:hypothetical protein
MNEHESIYPLAVFLKYALILLLIWFIFFRRKGEDESSEGSKEHLRPETRKRSETGKENEKSPGLSTVPRESKNRISDEKDNFEKKRLGEIQRVRKNVPGFIPQSIIDFERENKPALQSANFEGQEISPLACFGYRVGKINGRPENQRRAILEYAFFAGIPSFFPRPYASNWGEPATLKRFQRIIDHLVMLADQRDGRRNYEVAIEHWRGDAWWFKSEFWNFAQEARKFGFR